MDRDGSLWDSAMDENVTGEDEDQVEFVNSTAPWPEQQYWGARRNRFLAITCSRCCAHCTPRCSCIFLPFLKFEFCLDALLVQVERPNGITSWNVQDFLFDFSANYCHLAHNYSQANQTVHCLARLGSQQEKELIVTTNVPLAAREFGAYSYLVYRFGIYLACIPIWDARYHYWVVGLR